MARMKRELGEGRWDKILIKKMTALSVADNYNEAKEEWIATGDVWWAGSADRPDWVSNSQHPNYCLCGHGIVYHFRIRNTENGAEEIVGSDHINSYLIMRQIAQEKGIDLSTITDEQVEKWLKERVGSMKAEAWWKENGTAFETMFNAVKELDIWVNCYKKKYEYSSKYQRHEVVRTIRKKGRGEFGIDYEMASIVWRWNHPDNPKAQIRTTGFPNEKLMMDLSLLWSQSFEMMPKFEAWKKERINRLEYLRLEEIARAERREKAQEKARLARIEWEAGQPERERKARIKQERRDRQTALRLKRESEDRRAKIDLPDTTFENMCGFYDIPVFNSSYASTHSEERTLLRIKQLLSQRKELSYQHLSILKEIIKKYNILEIVKEYNRGD